MVEEAKEVVSVKIGLRVGMEGVDGSCRLKMPPYVQLADQAGYLWGKGVLLRSPT